MSQVSLEQLRIATPCHVDWNEMDGDDRVRFCSECSLNVYNLSEMARDEAEAFIAKREGRVCVRVYRRHDGTVVTKDCPVGRAALHRQVLALVGGVLAAIFLVGTGALASAGLLASRQWHNAGGAALGNWFRLPSPATQMGEPQMGDMGVVEPLAPQTPPPMPIVEEVSSKRNPQ